jgi:hypothetical protein
MKFEIDSDKVVEKAIGRVVEENILKEIVEDTRIEEIIEDVFENKDIKAKISNKIYEIVEEYLSSKEGKEYIIDALTREIDDTELLGEDQVKETIAGFIKDKLEKED